MKKIILFFGASMLLCVLLTSCGIPKPPEANQISQDLSSEFKTLIVENPFDLTNADVYDMDITTAVDKRQTNEKEDTAYCLVQLTNEYYRITKYLKLNYIYYDKGGWILEDYSEYQDQKCEVLKCPFDAEEIAAVLSLDYSTVEFKEVDEYFPNGGVSFYFEVEDAHKNGSYQGTTSVDLNFDGMKWNYEINSDQVEFIWDIEGTWRYLKIEEAYYTTGKDVVEIKVVIDSFNQIKGEMTGTWYMQTHYPILQSHSETTKLLNDKTQVGINVSKGKVQLWGDPDRRGMHSYVEFYPDKVEAEYATHSLKVELERQSGDDTTSSN